MSTPTPPDAEPRPDRDERELAALYRQLPKAEPDEALDARVLGAADAALVRKPRRGRWLIGMAGAASLVMAAGLTWHLAGTGQGPAGTRHPAASPPAVSDASHAAAAKQVVPVRILSEQQAARRLRAQEGNGTTDAAAPPPAAMAAKPMPPRTEAVPSDAQHLISQAQQALRDKQEVRARYIVRRLVVQYPNVKLPADLAPYAQGSIETP